MFLKHADITAELVQGQAAAVEAALRAIPPAFPLDRTVAVNPFLGQTGEDLATAAARLERVAGVRLVRPRAELLAQIDAGQISDDDLAAALIASRSPLKPVDLAALKAGARLPATPGAALPTLAELAAEASGTDWPALIERSFGLWAAGWFDKGQALWSPARGMGAYAGWRDWAARDLTPEIAGLSGFCAHVAAAPDTADRAILRAAGRLGLEPSAAETYYHRLLMDLGGWAQHARWLLWQAEHEGRSDGTLLDLLAIRLIWEEALLAAVPGVRPAWEKVRADHAKRVAPSPDHVLDAILQDAAERAFQRGLAAGLAGGVQPAGRPVLQAAFCIDVRSEVFRRALERQDRRIATLGFAGFFGLPVAHHPSGSDLIEGHLPVLLSPALATTSARAPAEEEDLRISARAVRAWSRFRQAAVSSFAFVEAVGPLYGGKLVRDSFSLKKKGDADPAPRFAKAMEVEAKAKLGARVLKAMSLTKDFGQVVLIAGHGAQVTNNPHESAYHCGACGGHTGEVSARLLAGLLNDPETRAGLAAEGIAVPEDTVFLAGLHDTTTDQITLFDADGPGLPDAVAAQVRAWLDSAGAMARTERALRLPGASAETLKARAKDWATPRPEWGLAGCAAFIAAPRAATAGADLGGRAFLHDYDWQADAGFGTLELILTAPVVVASWISLQYYGSTVAPEVFGGGNKLVHNVVGGIGVVEGNGGRLRPGLPLQAVHDGQKLAHDPLRLTVLVEAPEAAIQAIMDRHPGVKALFDNGWLHLLTLSGGKIASRHRPGGSWQAETRA